MWAGGVWALGACEAASHGAAESDARRDAVPRPDAAPRPDAETVDASPPDSETIDMRPPDADAVDADPPDLATVEPIADGPRAPVVTIGLSRAANGTLIFHAGMPAAVPDCADACPDVDLDGLSDNWEAVAMDALRPLLVFDEGETLVNDDPAAVVAMVARATPTDPAAPGSGVRLFILIGYSRDYGICGVSAHRGDPERVALDLVPIQGGEPGDFEVAGLYTAAHEYTLTDHSHVYRDAELAAHAVFEGDDSGALRWTVYPSRDKHGTYIDVPTCEGVSPIPCLDEDCAPDGVPAGEEPRYVRLPPIFNAGEPEHPLLNDLTVAGFPGDDAWAEQDFCGGLEREGCSAVVRDKLTRDPFVE